MKGGVEPGGTSTSTRGSSAKLPGTGSLGRTTGASLARQMKPFKIIQV